MKRLVIDFVFGIICFALGCYFGLQVGASSETEKQVTNKVELVENDGPPDAFARHYGGVVAANGR
ncbi:MAG: hypothetical protein WC027_03465 [Candidatus Paceibacterota bacterium]